MLQKKSQIKFNKKVKESDNHCPSHFTNSILNIQTFELFSSGAFNSISTTLKCKKKTHPYQIIKIIKTPENTLILLMTQKSCTTSDEKKNVVNNGMNYQPQVVRRISETSTVCLHQQLVLIGILIISYNNGIL